MDEQALAHEGLARALDQRPNLRPHWMAGAALVLSACTVLVLLWLVFRERPNFTVRTPVKVLTPTVRAGHSVTVLFDYCKEGHDIATVGTLLARRGVMIPLNLWPSDLPVGCHQIAVTLPIPAYVSEETYVLYMVREYRPTIFHTRGVSFVTEPFTILAFDGSPVPPIPFSRPPATPRPAHPDAAAPWRRK